MRTGTWRRLAVAGAMAVLAPLTGCDGDSTGPGAIVQLRVVPDNVRVEVGDSVRLAAEYVHDTGDVTAAVDAIWESADPEVATVYADGWVEGVGAGRAAITASAGELSGAARIDVPGWFAATPLPAARRAGHAAVLDGKIYYIGGNATLGGDYVATTYIFDPSTRDWSVGPSMPTARDQGATAVAAGKIFVIGGVNPDAPNNGLSRLWANEAYGEGSWRSLVDMPTARAGIRADTLNGKIYVVSGTTVFEHFDTVEVYDPVAADWSLAPSIPTIRQTFAIGSIGGKIYVAGGELASRLLTGQLEIFDPAADNWSTGAAMPTPRSLVASAVLDGKLVVIGGRAEPGRTDVVESYDPAADRWTTPAHLPEPRQEARAVVLDGILYVIGGVITGGVTATVAGFVP